MRMAEYLTARNAPLECRGVLERCVRVVIIVIVLPKVLAYGLPPIIDVSAYIIDSRSFSVKYV